RSIGPPEKSCFQKKSQSVPFKRPYVEALLVTALFYLALVGTTAALAAFLMVPTKKAVILLLGFAGVSAVLWFFSFLRR
ncbi:MAG: hypothetical protein GWO24_15045, partial [Akkermansiaceae bacterium]|nr:hypothetical protein [Akkermansiaceae bacterium]